MKRAPNLRGLLTLLGLLVCLLAGVAANAEVMNWTVDNVKREAIVIGPSKTDASQKAPVLFVFHWHGGTMKAISGLHFETAWPEAVVVYMQALPDNPAADPQGYGWVYRHDSGGDRDLKFVDAVLATLHEKFPVNDRAVFATGFSSGAMFTYALWDARPNIFAGFAVVAGRINAAMHLTEPKPAMVVAGMADPLLPFADQMKSIQTVRDLNGSDETGSPCGIDCTLYYSGRGAPVLTFIHSGGHVYPVPAVNLTVKFFKEFALPK